MTGEHKQRITLKENGNKKRHFHREFERETKHKKKINCKKDDLKHEEKIDLQKKTGYMRKN